MCVSLSLSISVCLSIYLYNLDILNLSYLYYFYYYHCRCCTRRLLRLRTSHVHIREVLQRTVAAVGPLLVLLVPMKMALALFLAPVA